MPDIPSILETLLQQQTPVAFQAHGPSMNPTVRDGAHIRVLPLANSTLKTGCIILYRIHGRIAVHRLIINKKQANQVFIAADAALRGGDWVPAADVLGVAESVIHENRAVRLDTPRARWAGLLRYHTRPLRRLASRLLGRTP